MPMFSTRVTPKASCSSPWNSDANTYPRGQVRFEFTREVNKRLAMPTVVLFRTADGDVTLAFVHRRPNKRDPQRDVLGSVSLIREIDAADPHRAHLDILAELSLPKRMSLDGQPWEVPQLRRPFGSLVGRAGHRGAEPPLLPATSSSGSKRAVDEVKLPDAVTKDVSHEEHVIRLITRLLFVWFIKEKGLVADDLFIENRVERLLEKYDARQTAIPITAPCSKICSSPP